MASEAAIRRPPRLIAERSTHAPAPGVARRRSRRLSARLVPALLVLLVAFGIPLLWDVDPAKQDLLQRSQAPAWMTGSWDHPLGTDGLGRDLLARIAAGTRLSLLIGVVGALTSAAIGCTLGLLASGGHRAVTTLIRVLMDVTLAVPFVVVGIVLTATLGQGTGNVLALLTAVGWVGYARVVQLRARSLASTEFVLAARAMGASRIQIARRHLLPNLLVPVLVLFGHQLSAMVLYEASLTYLGIGLPGGEITLGAMVRDGQVLIFDAWWVAALPGAAIALMVIASNLLVDAFQDEIGPYAV